MSKIIPFLLILLAGCASPRMVVPIHNPDLAPITKELEANRASTGQAKTSVQSAKTSVQRASVIVEKIVPSPEQAEQIKALKLELELTAKDLIIADDKLSEALRSIDDANALVAKKQDEADKLHAVATAIAEQNADLQAKALRADKAIWNRNRIIIVCVIVIFGLLGWIFKDPIILTARKLITGL